MGERYLSHVGREKTLETMIGKIAHYYPRIDVAVVILRDHLATVDASTSWGRMTISTRQ